MDVYFNKKMSIFCILVLGSIPYTQVIILVYPYTFGVYPYTHGIILVYPYTLGVYPYTSTGIFFRTKIDSMCIYPAVVYT